VIYLIMFAAIRYITQWIPAPLLITKKLSQKQQLRNQNFDLLEFYQHSGLEIMSSRSVA
jgi:hypothetical protein